MLDQCSTDELAAALSQRADLYLPDGTLSWPLYVLRARLGAIACVDGLLIRGASPALECGVIRRRTGPFAGRLCFVGGTVAYRESTDAALRRHFRHDLGIEIDLPWGWAHPIRTAQYCPRDAEGVLPEGFSVEPTKHSYSTIHLVHARSEAFVFGDEAGAVEWYTPQALPDDADFGYDMGPLVRSCLDLISR